MEEKKLQLARTAWWQEPKAGRLHCILTQEAKNKQEVGPGYKAPKPTLGVHFLQQGPTS